MRLMGAMMTILFAVQAGSAAPLRGQSDRSLDALSRPDRPWAVQARPEQKDLIGVIEHLGALTDSAAASLSAWSVAAEGSGPPAPAFRATGEELRDAPASTRTEPLASAGSLAQQFRRIKRIEAALAALGQLDREALARWRVKRALKKLEKRVLRLQAAYAGLRERADFVAADALDWQIERLLGAVRALRSKAR